MWLFKKKVDIKEELPIDIGAVYFFYKSGVDKPHPFHDIDDKVCTRVIDIKEGFIRVHGCFATGKSYTGGDEVMTEQSFRRLYTRKYNINK